MSSSLEEDDDDAHHHPPGIGSQEWEELRAHAAVFVSIASNWSMLGDIIHQAEQPSMTRDHHHSDDDSDDDDDDDDSSSTMDERVIVALLRQNMAVNRSNGLHEDILRVGLKLVNLRLLSSSSGGNDDDGLAENWEMSLERACRVLYCIDKKIVRNNIVPMGIQQVLQVAPILASDMVHLVQTAVEIFYRNEFQENISHVDRLLVTSIIVEKCCWFDEEDEDETMEDSNEEGDDEGPPPSMAFSGSAPAA
jgi:hypothetical protein